MNSSTAGIEVRSIRPDELDPYLRISEATFAEEVTPAHQAYWRAISHLDRAFGAFDRGQIVAAGEAQPFTLTVPGGFVDMAGLTLGRVLPSHRRRGLLTALIEARLRQARERGEPVAGLWASQSVIFGRYGFGWATTGAHYEINRAYAAMRNPVDPRGHVRLIDAAEAVKTLPAVYDRVRSRTPGMLDRSQPRWAGWVQQDPYDWNDQSWRRDTGPRVFAAWEDTGYVSYRLQKKWLMGGPEHRVLVAELMADDLEAYAGLWRWCLELDLTTSLVARQRAVDEPLRLMLADPRRLNVSTTDALWIRVLDVKTALEVRRYAAEGRVVLEVVDDGGYVGGRYRLETAGEMGSCRRAPGSSADVTVPVASLGAAYLGGTSMACLGRAGRADEHTPGALLQLDRMLKSDPLPWCPWVF